MVATVTVVAHLCVKLVEDGPFMVQSVGDLALVIQIRVTQSLHESPNSEIGLTRPCVLTEKENC